MKKTLSMLCVVLVIGFAGTAFAGKKAEKVDVCHYGSVYNWDEGVWEPGSFVINISGNAVQKHLDNHGDLVEPDFSVGEPVITEITIVDEVITDYESQPSCGAKIID